jgi:chromosome partitioning protein
VIVVANEDADYCRGATALHIAVGLLIYGQRVACIDLHDGVDGLSYCLAMRTLNAGPDGLGQKMPEHHRIALSAPSGPKGTSAAAAFDTAVATVGADHDFLIIATPRHDDPLARLVHAFADTVVTPLTDNVVDIDALSVVDPDTLAIKGASVYATMVREARRSRRKTDGGLTDWVVLRDKPISLNSERRHRQAQRLSELSSDFGFRLANNLCEFAHIGDLDRGSTAFDDPDSAVATMLKDRLVETLRLHLHQRRRTLAELHAQWATACAVPLEVDDIFEDIFD